MSDQLMTPGRIAYEVWCKHIQSQPGHVQPLPSFVNLPPSHREGWDAIAKAIQGRIEPQRPNLRTHDYETGYMKTHDVHPFSDGSPFRQDTSVSARVDNRTFLDTRLGPVLTYEINWPSIGATTSEDARLFAHAILQACDWLDAQRAEHEALKGDGK